MDKDMEITQPVPMVNEEMIEETPFGVTTEVTTEQQEKNFRALKNFFKMDLRSKEELMKLAPEELDDYDESSRIDYTDKLDDGLKGFEIEFNMIAKEFGFSYEVTNALKKFFDKTKTALDIDKYKSGIGRDVYRKAFSDMNPELIETVKDNCVGYTGLNDSVLADLIGKTNTINEVLHVMHSYIMNNEELMGAMPKIAQKENNSKYPITLYGEHSDVADNIFENFPLDLDVGWTDIISMEDKVLMMVRDRGHALTIDMDTSKADDISVKYFVPKLCNEEMIRALKGIDASSITREGARGGFSTNKEQITDEIFGFIEKVPTDLDMPRWWEKEENTMQEQNIEQNVLKPKEEPIIETVEPLFSEDDIKKDIIPDRQMSKLEKFQKKMFEFMKPLMDKFKGKENTNEEPGISVNEKDGDER